MTWQEANLALQLLAEERAGFAMRMTAEIARAREDAAWASVATAIGPGADGPR